MNEFDRFTTKYVEQEDRIRLSGETARGSIIVLWLTRRLLDRLLTNLLELLDAPHGATPEQLSRKAAIQNFAQDAAQCEYRPLPAVRVDAASEQWLVHSVEVRPSKQGLRLWFKGGAREQVLVSFEEQKLRQWLSILHEVYRRAEWPMSLWPAWVARSQQPARGGGARMH